MDYYLTKFKDRNPEETIEIIKNFFTSFGYEIHIEQNIESEIHTWSNYIELLMDGVHFMGACGKGMTNSYSLASGFAELYERFCNKMPTVSNLWIMNKMIEISNQLYNYSLHPDEKKLSIEEILEQPLVKNHFSKALINKEHQKQYINIICNKQPIGIPYKGFNNEETKYYDPRVLSKVITSTGMAAGNTIEEALTQGLSEIFERYAYEQLFTNKQEIYYQINIDALKNDDLKRKIKDIQKRYDFYVFDLSYNYKVPVVLSTLVNKKNHNIIFNMGCFPTFDIALERTLTELYQGEISWDSKTMNRFQNPLHDDEWTFTQTHLGSSYIGCYYIPEIIFLQNKIVDNLSNIYLENNNYSNIELNNYYKTLSKKMNINFYYADNSLIDEIKAIHIISDNFLPLSGRTVALSKFNKIEQNRMFNHYLKYYELSQEMKTLKNQEEIKQFVNKILIISNLVNDIKNNDIFLVGLNQYDYFIPYGQKDNCETTLFLIEQLHNKNSILDIITDAKESFYFDIAKKYLTLIPYLNYYNEYKDENMKKFLLFLNDTYTEEDFENYDYNIYLIQKIFIEPFQKELKSERFYKICKSLIKKS